MTNGEPWPGAKQHQQAMDACFQAHRRSNRETAATMFRAALKLELAALERYSQNREPDDPWLNILIPSTAHVAINGNLPTLARQIALQAGNPDQKLLDCIGNLADAAALDGNEHPDQT